MRMNFSEQKATNTSSPDTVIDVLLIEERASKRSRLNKTLLEFGYNIAKNSALNIDIITLYQPSVLILSTDLPSSKMLETLAEINQLLPLPIIIIAENDTPNLVKNAIKSGVSAYVVSEMIPQRLKSIITVATERFKAEQSLRNELKRAKDQLESRKYIEKAKGIIMEQRLLNEQQSYGLLRKLAMNQGSSLAEVAKNIIDVHALLSRT